MRELKFKAWDEEGKCWIPQEYFAITGKGSLLTYDEDTAQWLPDEISITKVQSLGIEDVEDNEIYEADVIEIDELRFLVEPIGTFEGDENHRGYCASSTKTGWSYFIDRSILKGRVIGNIFENPELVE